MKELKEVLNGLLLRDGKPIKTIVICDPGLDDLLMLLQILTSPLFEIVGIIPVYGNAKTYYTVHNTLNLCEFLGKTGISIYPGSDYNPATPDYDEKAVVYGQQGLGSVVSLPTAKKMKMQDINGIEFASKAIARERHLIISTASITEPVKILQNLPPSALKNIIAISLMGGVINATQEANWPIRGTTLFDETKQQQVSEANVGFDTHASKTFFDICTLNNIPILLSPLDLTHSILASENDITHIKNVGNPAAELAAKIIAGVPEHYQKRYREGSDGKFRQPLHDMHSSSCLMHPELYHGYWVTLKVSDTLFPQQTMITDYNQGNVFLLDIHYLHRLAYFRCFVSDLMHYQYLQNPIMAITTTEKETNTLPTRMLGNSQHILMPSPLLPHDKRSELPGEILKQQIQNLSTPIKPP